MPSLKHFSTLPSIASRAYSTFRPSADNIASLIEGRTLPHSQAFPTVVTKIWRSAHNTLWPEFLTAVPYVSNTMQTLHQAGLLCKGVISPNGEVNPQEMDHIANRHLRDFTQSPLDKKQDFPQFSIFSGDRKTRLVAYLLGLENVGKRIQFPDIKAEGQGLIRKGHDSYDALPRVFCSEQMINDLPPEDQHLLRNGIHKRNNADLNKEDWELLMAVARGVMLDDAKCDYIGREILGKKVFGQIYDVDPDIIQAFRNKEATGDKPSLYTANCLEIGQGINHYALPTTSVARTSALLRETLLAAGTIPGLTPDQGTGSSLEQAAVKAGSFNAFLEYAWREQAIGKDGKPLFYPNGKLQATNEGFSFNANGIFPSTIKAPAASAASIQHAREQASNSNQR